MIEKLKTPKSINWDDTPEGLIQRHRLITNAYKTVNQLADAVNELQEKFGKIKTKIEITEECLHPTARVDPYAEQRKWIGRLCFFWGDNKEEDTCYAVLRDIIEYTDTPFEAKDYALWYKHCEPVSPEDDIIYKKD